MSSMLRISNLPNLSQEVLVDSMAEVEFILKFTNFRSFWRLLVWDQNIRLNNRYFYGYRRRIDKLLFFYFNV